MIAGLRLILSEYFALITFAKRPKRMERTRIRNLRYESSTWLRRCIAGFHLTSWRPCWCTLTKRILIISFVWDTNMAAMSIFFCASWDCVKTKNTVFCNISNTRDSVSSHFETLSLRELNTQRAAEFFWRNSKCLEMWWKTVSSVWCIFSIETKTKEYKRRNKIVKIYAN